MDDELQLSRPWEFGAVVSRLNDYENLLNEIQDIDLPAPITLANTDEMETKA